ncbi:MAG: hypothetical protein ACREMG_07525 [Gemmatimonadales bacterium]
MFAVDWGTVTAIGTLVALCFGYLSRQLHRVDDKLTSRIDGVEAKLTGRIERAEVELGRRIDALTERYISHLERHPH